MQREDRTVRTLKNREEGLKGQDTKLELSLKDERKANLLPENHNESFRLRGQEQEVV